MINNLLFVNTTRIIVHLYLAPKSLLLPIFLYQPVFEGMWKFMLYSRDFVAKFQSLFRQYSSLLSTVSNKTDFTG